MSTFAKHKKIRISGVEGFDDVIEVLPKEMLKAASTMSARQMRPLINTYYQMQNDRIRANLRARAGKDDDQPHIVHQYMASQALLLEERAKALIAAYSKTHIMSDWLLATKGIGPIFTAVLIAYLDIHKAQTAGQFHAYAGLDPTKTWEAGKKKPWNTMLKDTCFLIGESFMKVSSRKDAYYGKVYKERKDYEWKNNLAGFYADYANEMMARKKFGDDTDAIKWYTGTFSGIKGGYTSETKSFVGVPKEESGKPGIQMLPPAQIHMRAKRYAVKMFLAHFFQVWYEREFQIPAPIPYPIAHQGHAHYIPPPNYQPLPMRGTMEGRLTPEQREALRRIR